VEQTACEICRIVAKYLLRFRGGGRSGTDKSTGWPVAECLHPQGGKPCGNFSIAAFGLRSADKQAEIVMGGNEVRIDRERLLEKWKGLAVPRASNKKSPGNACITSERARSISRAF